MSKTRTISTFDYHFFRAVIFALFYNINSAIKYGVEYYSGIVILKSVGILQALRIYFNFASYTLCAKIRLYQEITFQGLLIFNHLKVKFAIFILNLKKVSSEHFDIKFMFQCFFKHQRMDFICISFVLTQKFKTNWITEIQIVVLRLE